MLSEASVVAAADMVRRALECSYTGVCVVSEYGKVPNGPFVRGEEKIVVDALPCRLSHERISAAQGAETGAVVIQGVKLFCSPDVSIKPGSKLTVTQNGVTEVYCASGVPAVYPTHQEIMLELFRGWA